MSLDQALRVLGLAPDPSPEEISKAYKSLVLKFHPDRPGGDTEKMKEINEARTVIETGGKVEPSTTTTTGTSWFDEKIWDLYRKKYGPKPSGNYNAESLDRLAHELIAKNLLQYKLREPTHMPVDASERSGGNWSYWRPIGRQIATKKLKNQTEETLSALLKSFVKSHTILDIKVNPREAWVTVEIDPGRKYQSLSFEEVKAPVKKDPNLGLTPARIESILAEKGLMIVAGGGKNSYWAPRGDNIKVGYFILETARKLSIVKRVRGDRGIEDYPKSKVFFFGSLSEKLVLAMINLLLKYRNQGG